MPSAVQLVQRGQFNPMSAADRVDAAMNTSSGTEMAAMNLPDKGKLPACCPPWVTRPQGAPAIRQN